MSYREYSFTIEATWNEGSFATKPISNSVRKCAAPGCRTVLNAYNKGPYCYACHRRRGVAARVKEVESKTD